MVTTMEQEMNQTVYLFGFSKNSREFVRGTATAIKLTTPQKQPEEASYTICFTMTRGMSYVRYIKARNMGTVHNFINSQFGGYAMASFEDDLDAYKRKLAEYLAWENKEKILRKEKLLKQIANYAVDMQKNQETIDFLLNDTKE